MTPLFCPPPEPIHMYNHVSSLNVEWLHPATRAEHLCQRYLSAELSARMTVWKGGVFSQAAAGHEDVEHMFCLEKWRSEGREVQLERRQLDSFLDNY